MAETSPAVWSAYWQEADGGACLQGMPPALAGRLASVWQGFAAALPEGVAVLDIASGAGAVLRLLRGARPGLALTGVDSADVGPAARALGVRGGVDAATLPFADAAFGAVTAQFGLEYCAQAAWAEAGRVLARGGEFLAVCHHAGSVAVAHNRARLAAMQALADAEMFALARDMAAGRPEDPARSAAVSRARAAHAGQSIATELPGAIGQVLGRSDAAAMVAMIERRARAEMGRLEAMSDAALDTDAVRTRCDWLAAAGVVADIAVLPGMSGDDFAWVVRGRKG